MPDYSCVIVDWRIVELRLMARRIFGIPKNPKVKTKCWIYSGAKNEDGYGRMKLAAKCAETGKRVALLEYTHRISLALWKRFDLNDEERISAHECDNPGCFRPDHLRPKTRCQNMLDCVDRGRMQTHKLDRHAVALLRRHVKKHGRGNVARWAQLHKVTYTAARMALNGTTYADPKLPRPAPRRSRSSVNAIERRNAARVNEEIPF